MKNITEKDAIKYFGSVQGLIRFCNVSINALEYDLKLLKTHSPLIFNFVADPLLRVSTNNKSISDLCDKFQIDIINVLNSQIKEYRDAIAMAESWTDNP